VGANLIFSLKSLISSIPRLEAASISITSTESPSLMFLQLSQLLQGSEPLRPAQFNALASTLAVVVLPVPRVPQKR
jgi:hypothetical protein